MPPKDWDEVKGIVDALLKGLIGTTKDTGGSQTAGTVMGKENAILKKLAQMDDKVANNMILKQTEYKSVVIPSTGYQTVSFSFAKPVRILGIYLGSYFKSSTTLPVYIINGENSFQTSLYIESVGAYYSLVWMGTYRGMPAFRSSVVAQVETLPDIWATQLDIQIGANSGTAGSSTNMWVLYQEEG